MLLASPWKNSELLRGPTRASIHLPFRPHLSCLLPNTTGFPPTADHPKLRSLCLKCLPPPPPFLTHMTSFVTQDFSNDTLPQGPGCPAHLKSLPCYFPHMTQFWVLYSTYDCLELANLVHSQTHLMFEFPPTVSQPLPPQSSRFLCLFDDRASQGLVYSRCCGKMC